MVNSILFKFFLLTITSLIILFSSRTLSAQNNGNLWNPVSEAEIPESGKRYIIPSEYQTLKLDLIQMRKQLSKAPVTRTPEVKTKPSFLEIPWPDGSFKTFRIIESPCMEKGLMEKFPEIKTYAGSAVDDHSKYIKLDLTPQGFHAMILTAGEGTVYIDPYSFGGGDIEHYICYYKHHFRPAEEKKMVCDVIGTPVNIDDFDPGVKSSAFFGSCDLRTYRLAISATGEYTTFHGGTAALAQAAQVTTMNRVSGLYERDMAVHMNIIANNNLIIYTNSGTDPFSNGNTGAMINENQANTDAVIGSANYDIGHVFGTNSGGLAGLGVVCSGSKARGVTGSGAPIGDPFDIDYVAHEMGHQFDANHTQYNTCNRNNGTAMEPGSASTIMGYAGICAPNVQNNSDAHFHGVSLGEIGAFVTSSGGTCAQTTALSNNAPTISGTNAGVTVPGSTPFALNCIATDPDATDVLSYCWEQMDNTGNATQPPVATNTEGPNFRSNSPDVNPTRYFPNLTDLAAGVTPTWEVLASVSRTMNFRVSVRDNAPGAGGCTDETDVTINIDGNSGPFVVTYPSATGITWTGNTSETVTWTVAGTDAAPVSCANVDIYLSTDGGLTFPTLLASNVLNDGSQLVTVPNTPTSTARIMVVCSNGTFFDMSDNNFTITASTFDYTLTVTPSAVGICSPSNAVYQVDIGSIGGYVDPVTLSLTGVPAGGIATFSTNPVTPVGTSTLTISNTAAITPGTYSMTLSANSTSGLKQQSLTLTVSDPTSAVTLLTPLNGATAQPVPTSFTWNAAPGAGVTYDIDIATDAAFSSIVDNATGLTTNSFASSALNSSTTYYWRVRASNACGTTPFSSTFSFTTNNCTTYMSTNIPIVISASGTPTISSTLNIPVNGTISDINVVGLTGTHTWINDLTVTLSNPLGTSNVLWSGICNNEDNFDVNFDDAAAPGALPCPPVGAGTYQPSAPLSVYNGTDPFGNWTLTISDAADQDGGSLLTWGLEVCSATDYTLTVNNPNDTVCASVSASYTIDIGQAGTYTDPVTLSVTGLPSPAIATFSTNPVTPTGSSVLTVSNLSTVSAGTYNLTLNSASTSGPKTENLVLVVLGTPGAATLLTPADVATGVSASVNFTWSAVAGAGSYEIDIATDVAFSSIIDNASGLATESYTSGALTGGTTYYWRVRAVNACGTGAYSSVFSFATSNCTTLMSTDIPVSVPGVGTGNSTLTFPNAGVISDVNVIDVSGTHNRIQQIQVRVTSPAATTAILWDRICANENDFDVSFDDAATPGALPCPPVGGGTYQSQDVLSAFNGEDPAGTWTLTVQDFSGNGASATLQSWGLEVCLAPCALTASASSTPVICNGESNGTATATVTAGTPNYTYQWDSNAGGQTTDIATGLAFGSYNVTVSDAGSCDVVLLASVGEPAQLSGSSGSTNNVSCFGDSDGSTTISATGGTGVYSYDIGSGAQSLGTFNGLTANTYNITVTDVNNCTDVVPVSITQPAAALSASVSGSSDPLCNNGTDGTITVSASGGTTNYSYNIGSGGQSTATFNGLSGISYTITVTDANSCTATTSTTLNNPAAVTATANTGGVISCAGGSDGTATVVGGGGTGALAYLWSNGQTSTSATGLSATTYTVTVTDNNNCQATDNVTLTDPAGMISSATVTSDYNGSDISCNGSSDGSAMATVSGGTGAYTFLWSDGQTDAAANNLSGMPYSVTITDGSGCTTVSAVSLTAPASLVASATDNGDGTATAQGAGGTGSYSYLWGAAALNQTTATASGLASSTYVVTVTDGNGCIDSTSVTVTISGLEDIPGLAQFNVLPNPNTGAFVIKVSFADVNEANVSITNVLGQRLKSYNFSEKTFEIPVDIQHQASGIYFVILKSDNQIVTRKVTITK